MTRRAGGMLLVLAGVCGTALPAQGVRVSGVSWLQSIDLRPLRRDSVPLGATTGDGELRRTADGQLVACADAASWCTFLGSGPRETTRPLLHDVSVAAWGLGRGISLHAHGRARTALGGDASAWPRLDDRFDLLDAFAELDRPRLRVRLGRQWTLGGLGAYSYDGAALTLRRSSLDGDVFGGRALVQGLNESYTSAELGVVDDLPPERGAWLVGGRVRARPSLTTALSATYLRVVQDDRSGLYSERVSADASVRWAGIRLTTNYAADLATATVNEARLRASRTLGAGREASLELRRHRPFFELWTIWGAFAPVGYDEARATAGWRGADGEVSVVAGGAYRRYDDTRTGLLSEPLRTDGWRASLDASWSHEDRWLAAMGYGIDIGNGSSQSDATATLSWHPSDRIDLGGTGSALQTIYEFRVGTGRVLGGSAFGSVRLTSDTRLRVDVGAYRHRLTNDALGRDWSQRRASARLEWAIGADPGTAR